MSEPTTEQLSAFLDHELEPEAQSTLAAHVATCSECQGRLEGLRRTAYAIRALPMEAPRRSFTIPAREQTRRLGWAPVGWAASGAAAMLIVVLGITHLNGNGGGEAATSSAGSSSNPSALYAPQKGGQGAGAGTVAAPLYENRAADRVSVADPLDSSRILTVSTDQGVYPSSGSLAVTVRASGEPIGKFGHLSLLLRRGSYAVELPAPIQTSSSSTSVDLAGSYGIAALRLPSPRQGSYVLSVTWTDSSGTTLIAEVPVSIRG